MDEFEIQFPKQPKKHFGFLNIIISQAIFYISLLLCLMIYKFSGIDSYADFRKSISKKIMDITTVDTVIDAKKEEKSEITVDLTKEDTSQLFTEYAEDSDEAYVFDLSEIRLLSESKQSVNSMCMPVNSQQINSPFGYRINPVTGNYGLHSGIDINAKNGDEIYAALGGEVIKSKYSSDYGNFVTINHGDGLISIYAHCSKRLVEVGDKVEKGDLIALVGSTGQSTGPHLHFEVRVNGNRIDPQYFLPKMYVA